MGFGLMSVMCSTGGNFLQSNPLKYSDYFFVVMSNVKWVGREDSIYLLEIFPTIFVFWRRKGQEQHHSEIQVMSQR